MKKLMLLSVVLFCCIYASDAQTSLTLQPGPYDGMDAEIFSCVPCGYAVRNFGNIAWFDAIAWTKDGNCSNVRSLLRFDLSAIPQGATILSARLSLHFAFDKPDEHYDSHSPCNGTNAVVLRRITKPWDEHLVTWKNQPPVTTLHQVVVPGSHSPTQDYPNIDVRRMVQDMVNAPNKNFGFMMKLKKEQRFKKLLFGSSDHPDPSLRPSIRIVYTTSHTSAPLTASDPGNGGNNNFPPVIDNFRIIPNPAFRESIEWSFFALTDFDAHVCIMDTRGTMMYDKTMHITEGEQSIWMEEAAQWRPGLYIIKVTAKGRLYTSKFVIL